MKLIISETFYSLQGEGPSIGRPSVFLRLAACNLDCPGFSYRNPETGEHLGCDTKLVWKKGKPFSFDEILQAWEKQGWMQYLIRGAHLVITGGEPLLQQEKLEKFLSNIPEKIFLEVETNGTILPNEFLSKGIQQFNVSPKLSSALEPREKAYRPEVLQHFVELPQAIFKFVIQTKKDIEEVVNDYQEKFKINHQRIWLMPEGGSLKEMQPKMAMLAELCKQHHFNFSPRLHIHIWDEATGV